MPAPRRSLAPARPCAGQRALHIHVVRLGQQEPQLLPGRPHDVLGANHRRTRVLDRHLGREHVVVGGRAGRLPLGPSSRCRGLLREILPGDSHGLARREDVVERGRSRPSPPSAGTAAAAGRCSRIPASRRGGGADLAPREDGLVDGERRGPGLVVPPNTRRSRPPSPTSPPSPGRPASTPRTACSGCCRAYRVR